MIDRPSSRRSSTEVLRSHLALANEGSVDDDLEENYADRVDDGADSYVIRHGRIVAQSIQYTLQTDRGST